MTDQYRQGDLLFVQIERIPSKVKKRKGDVILEGEATGHAHRLATGGDLYQTTGWQPDIYVDILEPHGEIVHEEHGTIELPKGAWQVIRQREFGTTGTEYVMD